jgi:hypothetical protein
MPVMCGLGSSGWKRGEDVRTFAHIDFRRTQPPLFVGSEIRFPAELTILGSDVPLFRTWARENGVKSFRRIHASAEYLQRHHELVAHQFEEAVCLEDMKNLPSRIHELMSCARHSVLFVHITDDCTAEEIRRALRRELPDFTFRILYPRQVYRMWGARVILVERRRPRVFLFVAGDPMAGKTETALLLNERLNVPVVHGDEYLHGVMTGEIEAGEDLRRRVLHLTDGSAFDRALFADLLALMPELERREDFIFDFFIPYENHGQAMQYFEEIGFFPILCVTPMHLNRFVAIEQEMQAQQREAATLKIEADRLGAEAASYKSAADRLGAEVESYKNAADRLASEAALHKSAADRLGSEVEFHKSAADRLGSEVEFHKSAADRLGSEVEFYKSAADRLGSEAAFYKTEADRLGSEMKIIGSSTSWRITAPIRWFGGRFPSLALAGRRCLKGFFRALSSDRAESESSV